MTGTRDERSLIDLCQLHRRMRVVKQLMRKMLNVLPGFTFYDVAVITLNSLLKQ